MDTFKAMDPRVDEYIEKAADFAKPVLRKLRKLVHEACPDCHETIKWGFAAFDYKGPFCSMAAFKEHVAFGFWKTALLDDPQGILESKKGEAMGVLGRITSEADLPSDDILIGMIEQAKKLNDDGVKLPKKPRSEENKEVQIPEDVAAALATNILAQNQFELFPPGKRKEYIEWITEAKTSETRNRRIETSLEWISEGKGRNWKYEQKQ